MKLASLAAMRFERLDPPADCRDGHDIVWTSSFRGYCVFCGEKVSVEPDDYEEN